MPEHTQQFNFLTEYLQTLIEELGLTAATDEQKKRYIPILQSQLEERIGLELLPKLNDEGLDTFTQMINKGNSTAEEWSTFWKNSIPHFQDEVERILRDYAQEAKQILDSTK